MNVLLLVVDSLRGVSLDPGPGRPTTPFLDRLAHESVNFKRAYSTDCWTLPSHVSMFTGLLPSQHGAHFQSMEYAGTAPTLAEILGKDGFHTEVVTRNPVLDGTIPGVLRGFQRFGAPMAPFPRFAAAPLLLSLTKPRLRRQILETGFFHPKQAESSRFVMDFARRMLPADEEALDHVLARLSEYKRDGGRFFLFCNLFDVHAPYSPSETSILQEIHCARDLIDNAAAIHALAKIGRHQYLRSGFRLSGRSQRLLLNRYHRAIELMDGKLARFFGQAFAADLLRDTLVVLTSDHGEAFGEHGLFLHDASVYEPNIRVPLWVIHPERDATQIEDVVSLRDLFELIRSAALGAASPTLLDEGFRAQSPVAISEHFFYPRAKCADPEFLQNQVAAITKSRKVILRSGGSIELHEYVDAEELPSTQIWTADLPQFDLGAPAASQDWAWQHLVSFVDRPRIPGTNGLDAVDR